MQLLKRFKVIHFLSAFSLTIPSLTALSQTAYANDPPPLFQCIKKGEIIPQRDSDAVNSSPELALNPILIANDPQYRVIKVLEWINRDFQSEPPKKRKAQDGQFINYEPNKRCDVVAKRFQDFYECGLLQNIVQWYQPLGKKLYPAIFVQLDPAERDNQKKCLAQASEPRTPISFDSDLYLLFMLSKSDPRNVAQKLCPVRGFLEDDAILLDSWSASKKSQRSSPSTLSINSQPIGIKTCLENNFFLPNLNQDTTEEDK